MNVTGHEITGQKIHRKEQLLFTLIYYGNLKKKI